MKELNLLVRLVLLYLWELGIEVTPRHLHHLLFCLHSAWLAGGRESYVLFGEMWPKAYPSGPIYEELLPRFKGFQYDDPLRPEMLYPGHIEPGTVNFSDSLNCISGRLGLGKEDLNFITDVLVLFAGKYNRTELELMVRTNNSAWSNATHRNPFAVGDFIERSLMVDWISRRRV